MIYSNNTKKKVNYNIFNLVMCVLDLLLAIAYVVGVSFNFCGLIDRFNNLNLINFIICFALSLFFGAISYHCWVYRRD